MTDALEIDEEAVDARPDDLSPNTLYKYAHGRFWPLKGRHPGRRPLYPIEKMQEGESMFFPGQTKPINSIYSRAQDRGIKVVQRVVQEGNEVGVRVWHCGTRKQEGTTL